jgi:hypothetical protein
MRAAGGAAKRGIRAGGATAPTSGTDAGSRFPGFRIPEKSTAGMVSSDADACR